VRGADPGLTRADSPVTGARWKAALKGKCQGHWPLQQPGILPPAPLALIQPGPYRMDAAQHALHVCPGGPTLDAVSGPCPLNMHTDSGTGGGGQQPPQMHTHGTSHQLAKPAAAASRLGLHIGHGAPLDLLHAAIVAVLLLMLQPPAAAREGRAGHVATAPKARTELARTIRCLPALLWALMHNMAAGRGH
jgi:hypothetical protein